ncbi:DUF2092 domain-containing protein [Falsiroseomonas bella]|nr:DUF2092 domain-containing protein [Falsiroseomonas bella]
MPDSGPHVAVVRDRATTSMKSLSSRVRTAALAAAVVAAGILGAPTSLRAQGAIDADARSVLDAMSKYLGGLRSFSVAYAAVDEVVTTEGQKLQFLHAGELLVQRPDRLHAVRRGAAGVAEMVLDSRELILFGREANAFLRLPAPSIAAAVEAVHRMGFDAPGADLLAERPLDSATTDIVSGAHVGMTFIDGVEVHQLAFRGAEVDWQLWVTSGDRPLPVRYVITTKTIPGGPQYTLQLTNWNVAPQADPARFVFTPPSGARQLDPASVTANAVGDMVIR